MEKKGKRGRQPKRLSDDLEKVAGTDWTRLLELPGKGQHGNIYVCIYGYVLRKNYVN